MCVALPGRIVSVHERDGLPMASVDVRGSRQEVCLLYVPEADVGDWVLAHLGAGRPRAAGGGRSARGCVAARRRGDRLSRPWAGSPGAVG
jgi:hydrogenase assembly chaperone HypC/HupF